MVSAAIVLAAGRGVRLGAERPKGLVHLRGRTLLERSAEALGRAPSVAVVVPVVPPGESTAFERLARDWSGPARLLSAVEGGETRQASVGRGLRAVEEGASEIEWVLVHDAARCLVRPDDAERALAAAAETGAAVPAVPVSDTLKEVEGDRVVRTLDRSRIVAVQTPQAFRCSLLREALEKAEREGVVGTDCASLVERLGARVRICAGRPENIKVTVAADLELAERLLAASEAGA
jgi:2-C-methyl-D-erythritol 4-phosphate cytidylyltransferase